MIDATVKPAQAGVPGGTDGGNETPLSVLQRALRKVRKPSATADVPESDKCPDAVEEASDRLLQESLEAEDALRDLLRRARELREALTSGASAVRTPACGRDGGAFAAEVADKTAERVGRELESFWDGCDEEPGELQILTDKVVREVVSGLKGPLEDVADLAARKTAIWLEDRRGAVRAGTEQSVENAVARAAAKKAAAEFWWYLLAAAAFIAGFGLGNVRQLCRGG